MDGHFGSALMASNFLWRLRHPLRGTPGERFLRRLRLFAKIVGAVIAVLGSAALTLACMVALVRGTIRAVAIQDLPLRLAAVGADFVFGTLLLLACIYLATHLAVRIVGVGNAEFPPPPNES
jgi:hypothetical protein